MKVISLKISKKVQLGSSLLIIVALLASYVTPFIGNSYLSAEGESGITKIGNFGGHKSPSLSYPNSVAINTSKGYIYISNIATTTVMKLDENGNFISQFGGSGSGDGLTNTSAGILIDSNDNLYISDMDNNRVQKFTANGDFISKFGSSGSGDGQFSTPKGMSFDNQGNIYVVDGDRVQKFTANGDFISKFGSSGSGDGQLNNPSDVAVDAAGNVFVADTNNSRIQKFTANGDFISKFGSSGSGDGQFDNPTGITFNKQANHIYVSDSGNNRLQVFDTNGTLITKMGTAGSDNGQFNGLYKVAVDKQGNLNIADMMNQRIQKLSPSGEYLGKMGVPEYEIISYSIAIGNDNLYIPVVGGDELGTTMKFSFDGERKESISFGQGNLSGAAVASSSSLYSLVSFGEDGSDVRIVKTDLEGNHITEWQAGLALTLALDSSENVYWLDPSNNTVKKNSSNGSPLATIGSAGTADGQINYSSEAPTSTSIAVDPSGNIYVTDEIPSVDDPEDGVSRIQKFSANGNFVGKWLSQPNETLYGLSSSPEGYLYANLIQNGSEKSIIRKFNNNFDQIGNYTRDSNEESGDAFVAYGVSAGANGRIYVANVARSSVDILCDQDVSLNNCQSGNIPNPSGPNTIPNGGDGKAVVMSAPVGSRLTHLSAIATSSLPADQTYSNYSYPLGLVSFTLDELDPGSELVASLFFETKLKPGQVVPRKYIPETNSYKDIPGASVTKATQDGLDGLLLTYPLKDGGDLDLDKAANGTIIDPVGLAVVDNDSLVNTGVSIAISSLLAVLIILAAAYTYRDYRRHKRPLLEVDKELGTSNAKVYTYWHHIRLVTLPLIKYRVTVRLERREKIAVK